MKYLDTITKEILIEKYSNQNKIASCIAKELNVNKKTILKYLKFYGIKIYINNKGKNNPAYIDGRSLKKKYCIGCGKQIANYYAKRCQSCAKKYYYKTHHSPMYIDGRTNKKYYCKDCGVMLKDYNSKRCSSCSKKGRLNGCFGIKRLKHSQRMKNNKYGYIHGKGYEPYTSDFDSKLKEKIRKRDNYICQKCNKFGKTIHHIDYNKKNCNEDNLITLCIKCNLKVNRNRNYWSFYFRNKK